MSVRSTRYAYLLALAAALLCCALGADAAHASAARAHHAVHRVRAVAPAAVEETTAIVEEKGSDLPLATVTPRAPVRARATRRTGGAARVTVRRRAGNRSVLSRTLALRR